MLITSLPSVRTALIRSAYSRRKCLFVTSGPEIWSGLQKWREAGVDSNREWKDGSAVVRIEDEKDVSLPKTLAEGGVIVLNTPDPLEKARLTHVIYKAYKENRISRVGVASVPDTPARPNKPEMVPPSHLPSIQDSPLPKSVYMLHNLAHIELNAIDLAWDTLVRFSNLDLGEEFFSDFVHVADDESRHFCWCTDRMGQLGFRYGDMAAHDVLWRTAGESRHDVTARLSSIPLLHFNYLRSRLALVPLCQEARGLDAGPRLADRLYNLGDKSSASLVKQIAKEERAHVAVGLDHFHQIAQLLDCDAGSIFRGWVDELCPDLASGRFDHQARRSLGLHPSWYDRRQWRGDVLNASDLLNLKERLKDILEFEQVNLDV